MTRNRENLILLVIPPQWKFLFCIQDPIIYPFFKLQAFLIQDNESILKGLSFATKLIIVALPV